VTLSPVSGFTQWLKQASGAPASDEGRALLEQLDKPGWVEDAELTAQLRSVLEPLAAYYFLSRRGTSKGRLIDSRARFGNGARLERIDWLGDLSPKGLRESASIMVNYLFRLDERREKAAQARSRRLEATGIRSGARRSPVVVMVRQRREGRWCGGVTKP